MRRPSLSKVVVRVALAFAPPPSLFAQEVNVVNAQQGMVKISGVEFLVDAIGGRSR